MKFGLLKMKLKGWCITGLSLIIGALLLFHPFVTDNFKDAITAEYEPEVVATDSSGLIIIVTDINGNKLEPEVGSVLLEDEDAYILIKHTTCVIYPKTQIVSIKIIRVSELEKYKREQGIRKNNDSWDNI